MPRKRDIHFALLGFGKLGQGFHEVFRQKHDHIRQQTGINLILKRILVKHKKFERPRQVPADIFTFDHREIAADKDIIIVIDCMGGIEPTFSIIKDLIHAKKHIISANRALLATKMHQISDYANENAIHFLTEPSFGGGLPVAAIVQRDLVANNISELFGVVSGVSNFILDEMSAHDVGMREVLKSPQIQKMGESLSVIDYEGADSAMKVSILAATAFGIDINYLDIYSEGIAKVTRSDIRWAKRFGYEIKLVAILRDHDHGFEIRVHPTLVEKSHPITSVRGQYNACYIRTDLLGEYMVYGMGVGTKPSSSLILRDLVDISNRIFHNTKRQRFYFNWNNKPVLPIDDIVTSYYLRFPCVDRPGVMGEITHAIGNHNINITSAHAEVGRINGKVIGYVHIFIDHAREREVHKALAVIRGLKLIQGKIKYFRILEASHADFSE